MIKLYTLHCQKCDILERKLKDKGINFDIIDDEYEVVRVGEEAGISSAPLLQVDDSIKDFSEAIKWLNSQKIN